MTGQKPDAAVFESISRVITGRAGLKQTPGVTGRLPEVVAGRMTALDISSPSMYLARLTGASSGEEESISVTLKDEILSLIRNGLLEEAMSKAGGLDETGGKGFAFVSLKAWESANSGEYGKAMDGLNEAVRVNPLEPVTYYLMSQIHQLECEFEKAKETLKKTLYLDHGFIPAHLELASLYDRDNDPARARKSRLAALDVLNSMKTDRRLGWYDMNVTEVIQNVKSLL